MNKPLSIPTSRARLDASWLDEARADFYSDLTDYRQSGRGAARRFSRRIDTRIRQVAFSKWVGGSGWAVAALGGYGRHEMAPHSDVDLLFLTGSDGDNTIEPLRTAILQALWDAGLKVGHATRNLTECMTLATTDPTVATAHTDARHIAGDTRLVIDLVQKSKAHLRAHAATFIKWLREDSAQRHKRYGDTVYHLEPNLKLGEGGLRDAQSAIWAADVVEAAGLGISNGIWSRIPERIATQLAEGHDFLLKIRAVLHLETGYRGDRLTFDAQEKVARALGYLGDDNRPDTRRLMQDTYHQCQAVIRAFQRILDSCEIQAGVGSPSSAAIFLNPPFIAEGRYLSAQTEHWHPEIVLQLLSLRSATGLPLHPDIQDRLQSDVGRWDWTNVDLTLFWRLLSQADDGQPLFDAHYSGVLCAILPEFTRVTGLFQRNIFHTYTVDVHSLHAVVALKRLLATRTTPPTLPWAELLAFAPRSGSPESTPVSETPITPDDTLKLMNAVIRPAPKVRLTGRERWSLADLFNELVDHRPLFLATLLHDLGKGDDVSPKAHAAAVGIPTVPGFLNDPEPTLNAKYTALSSSRNTGTGAVPHATNGQHASADGNLGAALAANAARRLGLSPAQVDDVAFLVKRHLDMALLSQQRDLNDVAMIRAFGREVGSIDRLIQLTLLTYADMAAVHPDFLTQWRESLLVELYRKTRSEIENGEISALDDSRRIENVRFEVLRILYGQVPELPTALSRPIERFLGDMPLAYLLSTPPETIARHVRALEQRGGAPVLAIKYPLTELRLLEIVVVAQDKPGLLLLISGVMASCGLDIVGADVISRADGSVIDVFTVSDPHSDLIHDTRRMSQLDHRLSNAIRGELDVDELVTQELSQSRIGPRPVPQLLPEVHIDPSISRSFTVIDVSCTDQRALLYRIAKTLTALGLTIGLSRVSTVGHEARDTFYVTSTAGEKITNTTEVERIRRTLIDQLSPNVQQI